MAEPLNMKELKERVEEIGNELEKIALREKIEILSKEIEEIKKEREIEKSKKLSNRIKKVLKVSKAPVIKGVAMARVAMDLHKDAKEFKRREKESKENQINNGRLAENRKRISKQTRDIKVAMVKQDIKLVANKVLQSKGAAMARVAMDLHKDAKENKRREKESKENQKNNGRLAENRKNSSKQTRDIKVAMVKQDIKSVVNKVLQSKVVKAVVEPVKKVFNKVANVVKKVKTLATSKEARKGLKQTIATDITNDVKNKKADFKFQVYWAKTVAKAKAQSIKSAAADKLVSAATKLDQDAIAKVSDATKLDKEAVDKLMKSNSNKVIEGVSFEVK